MNTQQLISWMKDPVVMGKEATAQLDTLTQTFPYFQTAHLLYIKSLHNENSFLYNNQLKIAAAHATNRKVLYELITKKQVAKETTTLVNENHVESKLQTEKDLGNIEAEVIQPEFPKKKFIKDEDEWESGMLRQLQLLHHWQNSPAEILAKRIEELKKEKEKKNSTASETKKEELPSAADEINTLLYVLVEPGDADDIYENDEESNEIDTAENWEIKVLAQETPEVSTLPSENLNIPQDAVSQEIIREAINSSIELEVDDTLPSLEELGHKRKPETNPAEPLIIEAIKVENSPQEEVTFSSWLKQISGPLITEVLPEKQPIKDDLVDKFIQEQPRIQQNKAGFFNPINMAKKSVQDSDEFITETLAKIYVKQGNISKGIRAYQKLSLKFPEKNVYFAALIEELKRTPK
ncbi:MAG: hypothetical protein EXR20_00855 [Bacteroidetes bacterium]|nr:hypothetical protein [Bacteroidota bacterium]